MINPLGGEGHQFKYRSDFSRCFTLPRGMKNQITQFVIRVDVITEQRTDKLKLEGGHGIIFRNFELRLEKLKEEKIIGELDHAIPINVPTAGTKQKWGNSLR